MRTLFYVPFILILLQACTDSTRKNTKDKEVAYSFFLAGHVYGEAGVDNQGMHPPFVKTIDFINQQEKLEFGFLLGDMVVKGTPEHWDALEAQLAEFSKPVYKVVGNHDVRKREIYEERYAKTYYSMTLNNDLFIILDANIDSCRISNEQYHFLTEKLMKHGLRVNNTFILTHQLLWWDEDNKYNKVVINSTRERAGRLNFWDSVLPLVKNYTNNAYFIAGDLGSSVGCSDVMYDQADSVTYLATGMGGNNNFVIATVQEDKTVGFEVIRFDDGGNTTSEPITLYDVNSLQYDLMMARKKVSAILD